VDRDGDVKTARIAQPLDRFVIKVFRLLQIFRQGLLDVALDLGRPRVIRDDGEGEAVERPVVMLRKVGRDDPLTDFGVPRDKVPKELDGAAIEALQETLCDLFGRINDDLRENRAETTGGRSRAFALRPLAASGRRKGRR
jgi:hypothetical protein